MRKLLCVYAASLVLSSGGRAQITSMNSDRHFVTGARAASLADVYVAEPYDVVSMYTNPAALTWLLRNSVVLNYSMERILSTDNIMNENVAVPIPLTSEATLGVGATVSHVGYVRDTSPLSGFSYRQYGVEIAVGWSISTFLSIGAGVNARYGDSKATKLASVHGSVGALYSPSPEFSYGVSVQGLGEGLDYPFDPVTRITSVVRTKLDNSLQVGISWRFRDNRNEPILTVVLANQKIFKVDGLVYKGGIEYQPVSVLALRLGYWVGPKTLVPKFGAGVHVSGFQVDYAISPSELEPVSQQVSLSFDIGGM
ncbi:MAG: hypothetical protein HW412_334 [Bacteroidetes bacterium]|nr:hypothetical protein [Bacteroidota bacterium]